MSSPSLVLDARPLQPGFKAHADRGIGRYARNLLMALLELVDPARVQFIIQANLPDPQLPADIPRIRAPFFPAIIPVGKKLIFYHILTPLALRPTWRTGKVVHFLSHLDAPSRVGLRTVLTVHDLIAQRLKRLYRGKRSDARFRLERWLETRCLYRAARIIAVSQCTRQDICELYGIDPKIITVIPEAADPGLKSVEDPARCAVLLARHGLDPRKPFYLYLGGIDQRKGLDTLLQALQTLKAQGRPHRLALAGRIESDRQYPLLLKNIAERGLNDAVRLLGFVPDADLPILFSAATAFVFPSLYEGFGLPLLEAFACGAPVVAVRASAVPEVVGDAGILVQPGDASGLAEALGALHDLPELAAELRSKGQRRAALFSWPRAAQETLAIYQEVGGEA
ncbi:mannosyl-N-acetyl-alpha-D-glucosaminyl-diphospho-ditrans,octacis-undecaprenol 3-alpha-mannosyltransferase / alpha-1,3-rhamnosyltransferase [Desulfarculales bacterium]